MSPGATRTIRTSVAPPWANLRPATISTRGSRCAPPSQSGFRAPTLVEEHYTNVNVGPTTAFVQLAPDGPGTSLLGLGGGLKPERSTNIGFGVVLRPLDNLTATIDVYQILVTNRIVASGNINGQINGVPFAESENVTAAIAASGLSIDPGVLATGTTGINLFANGIDSRTRGVDFTLSSPRPPRRSGTST